MGTDRKPAHRDILGREVELAYLDALVTASPGSGAAVVVSGDAGIGKSALLAAARERAGRLGWQQLPVTGVENEAHLSFAGLHQLVSPILDQADRLPRRQRDALLAAFGLVDDRAPDRFLTALATLELLVEAAEQRPLLVLVEDAHWLDVATVDALTFIARRIESERIVIIVALRSGYPSPLYAAQLPELTLGPLDPTSAAELVDRRNPDLPSRTRRRVLADAEGNPLALVELPIVLQSSQANGRRRAELPLTTRLEQAFAARLAGLPDATHLTLLVAAAGSGDTLGEILTAAGELGGAAASSTDSLEPAIATGLVTLDLLDVRFRHPLVTSAVYQRASLSERRRIHAALADAVADPDRRAWHLSASAIGADEQIATQVELAATRSEARGGLAAAVDGFARAAELSPELPSRSLRLLRAADLALSVGDPARARALLSTVELAQLGNVERARVELLRRATELPTPGDPTAVLALASAADQLIVDGDGDLALRFLETAAVTANLTDLDVATRRAVSAAARRVPVAEHDPHLLAVLAFAEPETYGPTVIAQAAHFRIDRLDPESAAQLGAALNTVGAFDLSASFLASAVAGLREQGRLGRLPLVLTHQAWTAINATNWPLALPATEEAIRLADEVGQPLWGAGAQTAAAMLAALRGDFPAAEHAIRKAEAVARPFGAASMLAGIHLTRGVAALAAGHYDEAYAQLQRLLDPGEPGYHHFQSLWGVGDYAEAAARSGHREPARTVLADLERQAGPTPSPWLRVGLTYGRPLLADDDRAEDLFQAGLSADLSRWPLYRARLLLHYGSWLRRTRRVAASREPLKKAHEAFDALGVTGWADRTRQELRAAGERSSEPIRHSWAELSAQELQIAQLAAQGLSNREIGQRLFLSHRTIGSHLYRTFPKLGITSRGQLQSALGK